MARLATICLLVAGCLAASAVFAVDTATWRAGVAQVKITPEEPMWMSGYASRTGPAQGTLQDLWAKAAVLEDPAGRRAVLVTLDLVGIDRPTSVEICRRLTERYSLERASIALNTSHTHCGPVVGMNLGSMYFLDDVQWQLVRDYTERLTNQVVQVVGSALESVAPAQLAWDNGRTTFATNRRENGRDDVPALRAAGALAGPNDYSVGVLSIRAPDGKLRGVVFGYACHPTTLDIDVFNGDYAGWAQQAVQQAHPGAIALFWQGCGGDQNPLPRRTVELAQRYGEQLGAEVADVLRGVMRPIEGELALDYREVPLPLAPLPSREALMASTTSSNRYEARRATLLLEQLARGEELSPSYPYPIQCWRVGSDLTWVLLGGEVVVDYSLRLKRELGPLTTWVAGYSNDVMAYIPSRRVLAEGGYEGASSMVYYGLPALWAPEVEETLVAGVHAAVEATSGR